MRRWYVVYTQAKAEERAFWHLTNQNFSCFLPKLRRLASHARRKYVAVEPLFPRYLFVQLDGTRAKWRAINGSRGVVGLLTNSGDPIPVSPGVVERLRESVGEQGIAPISVLGSLAAGQKVRINSGALAGVEAEVEQSDWTGGTRVRLLMSLLGKTLAFDMPAFAVEPV